MVTTERFTLLERLAARVAEVVLDHDPRVDERHVTVRKLAAAGAAAAGDTSGVRIERARTS